MDVMRRVESISITDSPVERNAASRDCGFPSFSASPQTRRKGERFFFHVLVLGLLHLWFVVLMIYARRQSVWQFNSSYFSTF